MKPHKYSLYVRRSYKFKWTCVSPCIRKPIIHVKKMAEDYTDQKYHGRGEIWIYDNLSGYNYKHIRKPKILC